MEDCVIVGNGGLSKEIKYYLDDTYNFLGFVDNYNGENVIGNDDWLVNFNKTLNVFFGIGTPTIIKKLYTFYSVNKNLIFPNFIHKSFIGDIKNIKFGKGNIITPGVIFTTNIDIGDFNIFNLNTTVGHDVKIGNFNIFNPSASVSGLVSVGNCVLFGAGSVINERLNVVDNVTIGSGTVVVKSINEGGVYVGIPSKKIK